MVPFVGTHYEAASPSGRITTASFILSFELINYAVVACTLGKRLSFRNPTVGLSR